MRPIFAVALGTIAWLFVPGNAGAQTTSELLHPAHADTIDIPRAGLPCWYYMAAIQNASVLVDRGGKRLLGVCAPPDATLIDHVRIFVRYARRNQKDVSDNAAAAAVTALSEAYPCGAN
jgi:Rap1a immunity proteins